MITEEAKLKNYSIFIKKLNEIGVNTDLLNSNYQEKIINASFTYTNEYGVAYDGSLLQNILRVLTPYALKINENLPDNIKVEKNSLLKVCLLSHIAKCISFEKNTNQWEVNNRGLAYKYATLEGSLKLGMRSLMFCHHIGITFTDVEAEAMIVIDRDENESQVKYFSSPLAIILKQANELTFLQNRLDKKV